MSGTSAKRPQSIPESHVSSAPSATTNSATIHSNDEPVQSTMDLFVAHAGGALALFLATTDATIISTSLPTITQSLRASSAEYTWIAVAYLLTQTALQPMYGRLSDILGRKTVCHMSILVFALGSVLCGCAQTSTWLIAARALSGVGAGGIVACVWVITSEIVPPHARAKWSQALSVTWSCSAVAGPLLGGVFSSGALGWRWIFFLNIPICMVASALLSWSLRHVTLSKKSNTTLKHLVQNFDFIGLALFMISSGALVTGLTLSSADRWTSPLVLTLIIVAVIALVCGGWYETCTKREAIFAPAIFFNGPSFILLAVVFLHNLAFNTGTFYLALWYQAVNGQSPLQAGIQILPYSLGSSVASIPTAWLIQYVQRRTKNTCAQKCVTILGLAVAATGFGVMLVMNVSSTKSFQAVIALISGIGIGAVFHAPYQIFAARLGSHLASGTGAFFLVRFTGATLGLSIAGSLFHERLSKLSSPPMDIGVYAESVGWSNLRRLAFTENAHEVLGAVVASMRIIWAVCAGCLIIGFLLSLFLPVTPLELPVNTCSKSSTTTDVEKFA